MIKEKKLYLSAKGITKTFGFGRQKTVAIDNVDLDLYEGEVVSIVGESGSGKTTLSKVLLGLMNPTSGDVYFQGVKRDISSHAKKQEYWKNIQAIFQDPFSSYNIFNKIDSVLLDCINMRGGRYYPREKKIEMMTEACSFVNLKFEELTNKYPMIDACSRATILDELMHLRKEIGMTIIFITHDIGLAYYVSDSVYIMEKGKFVEGGSADEVILSPRHPYTKRLINDVPKIYEEWDLSTV